MLKGVIKNYLFTLRFEKEKKVYGKLKLKTSGCPHEFYL